MKGAVYLSSLPGHNAFRLSWLEQAELNASREKNGVYLPFDEFKRMEMDIASKERNIEELQAELGETKQDLQTMTV